MNKERYKELMKERFYQTEEYDDEYDDELYKIWEELPKVLSEDIKSTIEYIKNDCPFKEFYYLSEVIENVVSETQSEELVNALYIICNKYKKESDKYNMWEDVNNARLCLDKYYDELLVEIIDNSKKVYEINLNTKPGDKFYKDSLFILKTERESIIDALSKDIPITCDYLKNKCSLDNFIFLSEFFPKVAKRTQSKEFVDCVCEVYDKFKKDNDLSKIKNRIKYIKTLLK